MLDIVTQFFQTKNRTKMKRYYLLMLLVCLLGSNALAQSNSWTTTIEVKETIDFTGWNWANNGSPNVTITPASNYFQKIFGTSNNGDLEREYTDRVYVDNLSNWQLWRSDTHQETYFQKHENVNSNLYIKSLNKIIIVIILF